MKASTKFLKNGMRLIFVEDKTKHKTEARIYINYGNREQQFKYNKDIYNIKCGSAHLLEHCLIESSELFNEDKIYLNGFTSLTETWYCMSTTRNFYKYFKKFLYMVNHFSVSDELLLQYKAPIYNEMQRDNDRKNQAFWKLENSIFFKETRMVNVLGTKDDVKAITKEELELIHHVFYQPKNETICFIGNFDCCKVEEIISEMEESLNIKEVNYKLLDKNESIKINKKDAKIVSTLSDDIVSISFKIDISKISSKKLIKIIYYLNYFLYNNFSDNSPAFKKVTNEKLSPYSFVRRAYTYDCRILKITIALCTKDIDRFKDIVFYTIKVPNEDIEDFKLWKKENLVEILNRSTFINSFAENYIDNVLDYNYIYEDKIEDIEGLNYNEYKKVIQSLDFSNYCITCQENKS